MKIKRVISPMANSFMNAHKLKLLLVNENISQHNQNAEKFSYLLTSNVS